MVESQIPDIEKYAVENILSNVNNQLVDIRHLFPKRIIFKKFHNLFDCLAGNVSGYGKQKNQKRACWYGGKKNYHAV